MEKMVIMGSMMINMSRDSLSEWSASLISNDGVTYAKIAAFSKNKITE